jgi:hypothetical protein
VRNGGGPADQDERQQVQRSVQQRLQFHNGMVHGSRWECQPYSSTPVRLADPA